MYTKEGYPIGSTSSGVDASLLRKKRKEKSDDRMGACSRESKERKGGNDIDFSIMSPLGIFILKSLSMSIIHISVSAQWRNWIDSNGERGAFPTS